jgi:hypothetical protein
MALYHNGALIGERKVTGFSEGFAETHRATLVGHGPETGSGFNGELGQPVVLNSYTSQTTPTTPADLHAELCPAD